MSDSTTAINDRADRAVIDQPTAEHLAAWLGRLLAEADEPFPTWEVDVNTDGQKLWLTVDDGEEYEFIVAVWEVET